MAKGLYSLKKINSLDSFEKFLSKVTPKIGFLGGRSFQVSGNFYNLNEIVKKFDKISQNCTIDSDFNKFDNLRKKIKEKDQEANKLLKKRHNVSRAVSLYDYLTYSPMDKSRGFTANFGNIKACDNCSATMNPALKGRGVSCEGFRTPP